MTYRIPTQRNNKNNMEQELLAFIARYVKEIQNNNAAVFIGAGLSKSSGYVEWKNLLKNVAQELGLDITKEQDLVSLAQYYCNENGNRSVINETIFEEFSQERAISENHKILSRLPISTYWTTNYDTLIEDALLEVQKVVDVKHNNSHFSITKPQRDAIVYKMHGDKSCPNDAIIIKDDYEKYYRNHVPFLTALSGDLISKTFLFLGFSFSDPNIDYILSRIRIDYGEENPKQHYAIMRNVQESDYPDKVDFEYAKRKHELFISDLKRYNIKALLIDDYAEITKILHEIEKRINQKNIFISGSAAEYGDFNEKESSKFIQLLSTSLIKNGYNLISGFGLGVGSDVIIGALNEIYMNCRTINKERLLLRPFPQGIENDDTRNKLWTQYREDMISRAGISIFIFGNKRDSASGNIVYSNGVKSEYEIAKKHDNLIIPIGCTGYVAKEIWSDVADNLEDFYPGIDRKQLESAFNSLNVKCDLESLVQNVVDFIILISK